MPRSAYSGWKVMPDFASLSDASTSWVLLPMDETIPIPVKTTRLMSTNSPPLLFFYRGVPCRRSRLAGEAILA
jgi:hypothetical protein